MKEYRIIVTVTARKQLRQAVSYIAKHLKNPQAAQSVFDDFHNTIQTLTYLADTIVEPRYELLQDNGLKRLNLQHHSYFILFKVIKDTVYVTNVFHFKEDYLCRVNSFVD